MLLDLVVAISVKVALIVSLQIRDKESATIEIVDALYYVVERLGELEAVDSLDLREKRCDRCDNGFKATASFV